MPVKLYTAKNSGSFSVEAALALAGVSFVSVPLDLKADGHHSVEFSTINPLQQVPALVLDDGTILTESVAMILHLADLHPSAGLAPASGTAQSARFLRWMIFMAINLYEPDLHYFYPERYTDAAGVSGTKAAAASHMRRCFALMEEHALQPGPFICGDRMTMADVYLAMLTNWSPEPIQSPRILAVVHHVAVDPTIAPIWNAHGMGQGG